MSNRTRFHSYHVLGDQIYENNCSSEENILQQTIFYGVCGTRQIKRKRMVKFKYDFEGKLMRPCSFFIFKWIRFLLKWLLLNIFWEYFSESVNTT